MNRRESPTSPRDHDAALAVYGGARIRFAEGCRRHSVGNRKALHEENCNQTEAFSPRPFVVGNLFTESS